MENFKKDVVPKGSRTEILSFSRNSIFKVMDGKWEKHLDPVIDAIGIALVGKPSHTFLIKDHSKQSLKRCLSTLKKRWKEVNRKKDRFLKKYKDWLNESVKVSVIFLEEKESADKSMDSTSSRHSGGRPEISFSEASERSKRRKAQKLRDSYSVDELSYATKMGLRESGAVSAAKVIDDVTTKSPTRALKYINAMESASKREAKMSSNTALALVIDSKLIKSQYMNIRHTTMLCGSKVFPSYNSVLEAKKLCYPSDISISETRAEVSLQSLLDHTGERILQLQNDVLDVLKSNVLQNMSLIVKWGFDGSSGQSEYKQKFAEEGDSDSNVLLTSLVPLQLIGRDEDENANIVIWKNPRPSSPWYCRPIRLQFKRETEESTLAEKQVVDKQIEALQPLITIIDGKKCQVNCTLTFTMIDGKVCNAVTGTKSAMCCYICNATSKNFNDLEAMRKLKVDKSKLQYGLSTLHCWIRFFECLLHVEYKLKSKKWQARGKDAKNALKEIKLTIQKAFQNQLNLLVDRPKQGMGNSNDGNTARRFFENTETSARILGVNVKLMKRFHIILQVISSGFNVKVDSFSKYCNETADLFVELYPWYCMSTTVHKVLLHGSQIVEVSILPIGQLSEEAQESRNKDVRNYREHFARKNSRKNNIEDIFLRLLASSDPLISSFRKTPPKIGKSLFPEALALLKYDRIEEADDHVDDHVEHGDDD